MDDDELLEALGVSVETKASGGRSPKEERMIAGFEDIVNFVKEHGRAAACTAKIATFSNGFMPCGSTACASSPSFMLCWHRLTNSACFRANSRRATSEAPMDDDALLAELGVGTDDPERPDDTEARQAARGRRGNRQPHGLQGFRPLQAAFRSGAEGSGKGRAQDTAISDDGAKSSRASFSSSAARKPISPKSARNS